MKMFSGKALIESLDEYHKPKLDRLNLDPDGINTVLESTPMGVDGVHVVHCLLKLVGKEEDTEAVLILDHFIYDDIVYDINIDNVSQEIH